MIRIEGQGVVECIPLPFSWQQYQTCIFVCGVMCLPVISFTSVILQYHCCYCSFSFFPSAEGLRNQPLYLHMVGVSHTYILSSSTGAELGGRTYISNLCTYISLIFRIYGNSVSVTAPKTPHLTCYITLSLLFLLQKSITQTCIYDN